MESSKEYNIEIEKSFSVPANRLYQSWINPEDLKQWWTPLNSKLTEVENEVTEGGKIKYTFVTDQSDKAIIISGDYLEVEENKKLVYNWNWETGNSALGNGKYKLTITFSDEGEGSSISVKQEGTESDESLLPHREGWEKSLEDLDSYLSGDSGSETDSIENNDSTASEGNQKTDGAGYNELPDQEKVGS